MTIVTAVTAGARPRPDAARPRVVVADPALLLAEVEVGAHTEAVTGHHPAGAIQEEEAAGAGPPRLASDRPALARPALAHHEFDGEYTIPLPQKKSPSLLPLSPVPPPTTSLHPPPFPLPPPSPPIPHSLTPLAHCRKRDVSSRVVRRHIVPII